MLHELKRKDKRLLEMAFKGARTNAEVYLLDEIEKVDERVDGLEEMLDQKIEETKELIPNLDSVKEILESIRGRPGEKPTDEELLTLIKPIIPKVEDGHTPTKEELLTLIKPLIPQSKDGETPSDERLLALITPLIPLVENGKDADPKAVLELVEQRIPEIGERIRDSLELLQGNNRLDASAIKGLTDELKKLTDSLGELRARPAGRPGMKRVPIIKRYNLSSQVDGTLKAFTLPQDTVDVVGVFGSQFPLNFNPGTDWTFSGRTLTLADAVSAPNTGETLFCIIETLFYG